MSAYALLDADRTKVLKAPVEIDADLFADWVSTGNPKAQAYRPVNMTPVPDFDSSAQTVIQDGWEIINDQAQPHWVIVPLNPETVVAVAADTDFQSVISQNVVTLLAGADAHWTTLTPAQKDDALHLLVKVIKALLKSKFGIQN